MERRQNILEEINRSGESYLSEIDFKAHDFSISKKSLSEFMGYKDAIPGPLENTLDELFTAMPVYQRPSGGFRVYKNQKTGENGFFCNGVFFKTGRIIARNLIDAEYIAFFMVTAGLELDNWSTKAFKQDNMLLGYSIDCAGSEMAEELADGIEKRIAAAVNENASSENTYHISNRYSPGYCGWDVAEQRKLFTLFPKDFCRITLTESSLMIPKKSVSGIIGIGKEIKKTEYQCSICERGNCFRKKLLKDISAE